MGRSAGRHRLTTESSPWTVLVGFLFDTKKTYDEGRRGSTYELVLHYMWNTFLTSNLSLKKAIDIEAFVTNSL